MVIHYDAANPKSFISGSTILNNLVGTNVSASLVNGNLFDSSSGGAITVSGSTNYIQVNNYNFDTLGSTRNFTIIFVARKDFYGVGGNNVGNSTLFQGANSGFTTGWRIYEENTGPTGSAFSGRHVYTLGIHDTIKTVTARDNPNTYRNTYVAFSVSPGIITGFCNGNFVSSSAPTQSYASGSNSGRISVTGQGIGSWEGKIYMMQVYERPLSRDEILQNYNAVKSRFGIE